MPNTSASTTSQRLLALLSLLQSRRDWPGRSLAERLDVSERTVRRDVDRLRELDYTIQAIKGPDGGYRLAAGTQLPPLLFDDEQAVALSVALRTAVITGAGIEEAAARALTTMRQVMPARLRGRIDRMDVTTMAGGDRGPVVQADTDVLLAINAAIHAQEVLRFDYNAEVRPAPRQAQPHALVLRSGLWYLLAWVPAYEDWRTYRADRIKPRIPNGPRFERREVPGGDVATFVAARFKGSTDADAWPCMGEAILHTSSNEVLPYVGDGEVESIGPDRCRVRLGSWSWSGLAAGFARFDADLEAVDPPELRTAFADLAQRANVAARSIENNLSGFRTV